MWVKWLPQLGGVGGGGGFSMPKCRDPSCPFCWTEGKDCELSSGVEQSFLMKCHETACLESYGAELSA